MIAFGSDHVAVELKKEIMEFVKSKGYECKDFGTYTHDSCDYPVYGEAVANAVVSGECDRALQGAQQHQHSGLWRPCGRL